MYSNPYDFQRPVKEPQLFAGRHQELKEAGYYLIRIGIETAGEGAARGIHLGAKFNLKRLRS